jgi:hypothetical protein
MRSACENSSASGVGGGSSGVSGVVGCSDGEEPGEVCPVQDERAIRQQIRTIVETTNRKAAFILLLPIRKNSPTRMKLYNYSTFIKAESLPEYMVLVGG